MNLRSIVDQKGFSLIEVVVALAIVALMLGTIYQMSTGSMQSTARTDNYLRALAMAQSRIDEAAALPNLKIGTMVGSSEGVAWSRSIAAFEGPPPTMDTRLYQVTVIAARLGSKVTLETLVIAAAPRE